MTKNEYNVTIVNPFRGTNETHLEIHESRIDFENNTFEFNAKYNKCPILKIERISKSAQQYKNEYFAKYGTKAEF